MRVAAGFSHALLCASLALPAAAQETHHFTIGEKYEEAPDGWYACYTDTDQIAQDICSTRMPDGSLLKAHYTLEFVRQWSGNRCGYNTFRVDCHGLPKPFRSRRMRFRIGEIGADAPCGTDPVAHARDYCMLQGGPGPKALPFTLVRTRTVGGNRCGYNTYEVVCRQSP
jgi:hypothetical protein